MKKRILLMMAFIVMLGCLVACADEKSSQKKKTDASDEQTTDNKNISNDNIINKKTQDNSALIDILVEIEKAHKTDYERKENEEFVYNAFEDHIEIVEYIGNKDSVTIPEKIDGLYVTELGDEAFYDVESYNVSEINFPDSIYRIGGVALINTKWYENQSDGLVYAGHVAYRYKGDMTLDTEIVLKEGTLGIAERAFYNIINLKAIYFPETLICIGRTAFYECEGLTELTFPSRLVEIDFEGFGECTNLEVIHLNEGLRIERCAFYNCPHIYEVDIPKNVVIHSKNFGCYWDDGDKKVDNFKIYGISGSDAEKYAEENGFQFIAK